MHMKNMTLKLGHGQLLSMNSQGSHDNGVKYMVKFGSILPSAIVIMSKIEQ